MNRIRRRVWYYTGSPSYGRSHLTLTNGSITWASGLRRMFKFLPREPYRVEYQLDPLGPYRAGSGNAVVVRRALPHARAFVVVCFIPQSWAGKRFSRKVLPWR